MIAPLPTDELKELADREAEEAVVGSLLLCPQLLDELRAEIQVSDFNEFEPRTVFEVAESLHVAGKKIDPMVIARELKKQNKLDVIGGAAYLAKLFNTVPTYNNARYYASVVRELASRRHLSRIASKAMLEASDATLEIASTIAGVQSSLSDIETRTAAEPVKMPQLMGELLVDLEKRFDGQTVSGRPTGFKSLDAMLGGFHDGELIVLAARPGMGKSALAMGFAHRMAKDEGPVLVVSLEMSKNEFGERILSSQARVEFTHIRKGCVTTDERRLIVEAASKLSGLPLCVDDRATITVRDIAATARMKKRKGGLSLVVIDYLQLITPANSRTPRQEQVAEMTRSLKVLAKELQVPVLCLAQLNRQSEQAANKLPTLSNLRESGAIEQDADVVLFVHREEYYSKNDSDKGKAEIIVAKQRNGPTGVAPLVWLGSYCTFENAAEPERYTQFDNYNAPDIEDYGEQF